MDVQEMSMNAHNMNMVYIQFISNAIINGVHIH